MNLDKIKKEIQQTRQQLKRSAIYEFVLFKDFQKSLISESTVSSKRTSAMRPNRIHEQLKAYNRVGLDQGIVYYYGKKKQVLMNYIEKKDDEWYVEIPKLKNK